VVAGSGELVGDEALTEPGIVLMHVADRVDEIGATVIEMSTAGDSFGGADGTRTLDLLAANHMSQELQTRIE
jgi:hypothetical protein